MLIIKVDTGEKQPYYFEIPTETGALSIGDYFIVGFEDYISIECKEINDLLGCLTQGRERFEKELHRGRALNYFAMVTECTFSDLASGQYKSEMNTKSAIQSLPAFSVWYRLPIFFAGNRQYGQRITESLLCKYARECEKKIRAL